MINNCKCLYCESAFHRPPSVIKKGSGKYCSMSCYSKSMTNGKNVSCPVCSIIKYKSEYNLLRGPYCSRQCAKDASKTGKIISCVICGKSFYASGWDIKTGVKHCSHKCAGITQSKKMKCKIPWMKGRTHSEQSRKKMAYTWFKKGDVSLMKGKTHTSEAKNKMAPTFFKKGHISWMCGKTHSVETKEKIRIMRMKQIFPTRDTVIERLIQAELDILDLKYEKHFVVKDNGYASQLDIAIPSIKFAIECDGDYWHSLSNKRKYDDRTNKYCQDNGWTLIRFSENNIKKDLNECIITIKRVLDYLTTADKL